MPATPPLMKTALRPSWYSSPSMTGLRGSYSSSRARTAAAAWIALTPVQLRARVRPLAAGADLDAQGALAAGLDDGVGRLHQDREVRRHQVGVALRSELAGR